MLNRRFSLLRLTVLCSIFTMLFAGCGGTSGSSSNGSAGNSISGVVVDGYLAGARVFLDLNGDRLWNGGEPYSTSNTDGTYNITDITVDNYNSYPVVAEVTSTTTDQDTGKPVSHPYTLVSPAGHPEVVSPLTTMIQVSFESNPGITLGQAFTEIKGLLSMDGAPDVDLYSDYITQEQSNANYAKLHNIAQLSARLMGANISAIESAAQDAGVELDEAKDEILRMAVKEIMQSINLIADTATEITDFDADQEVQTLDIRVGTTNIAGDIAAEAAAAQYQTPLEKWATIFRSHDAGGNTDFLCLGLAYDMDLTGYTFSADGPDGTEYIFDSDDRYTDPDAPIAWAKYLPDLPEGEYIFYVTIPGGQKVELGRDTHVHAIIPALSLTSARVASIDASLSRVYHDTLNGTYYYRMMIRNSATGEIVYRTKRRECNIQEFSSQYATADYQYRLEVWDKPVLKDATARYRTGWATLTPTGVSTESQVEFYKGYRRIRYTNGIASDRLVLDIAITHPENLNSLTITDPGGNPLYNFDLSLPPGQTANSGSFYFTRMSGTTDGGTAYGDYFLQDFGTPPSGVYTWDVEMITGEHIYQTVTIYDQTALPCVNSTTVSVAEDQYGQITVTWDPVDWSGKPVFYRVAISKDMDWDNEYCAVRIPATNWTGNRANIEAFIGGSLDESGVAISVWVLDSQSASTVHNRTDFAPVPFTIN